MSQAIYVFHATCPVSFPLILQYPEQQFFRLHLYLQKAISVSSGYVIIAVFNKHFYKFAIPKRLTAWQFFHLNYYSQLQQTFLSRSEMNVITSNRNKIAFFSFYYVFITDLMPVFTAVYLKMASYNVFFQCRHAYLHIKYLTRFHVEVKNMTFWHFYWHI